MRYIILLFLTQVSLGQDTLQKSLEFEQTVADHLKEELADILPADSFVIIPSIKLKSVRTKVLSQSENFQQVKIEKNQEPPSLPGFDDMKEDSNQSNQRTRNVYEFKDDLKVEAIALRVIIEKSLPKELVNLAKKTLRAKVKASFGAKAKISFSSSDLVQSRMLYEHNANWQSVKTAFMGNWKTVLALLAAGVGMVALMIYLVMLMKKGNGYEQIRDVQPLAQYDAIEEPKEEIIEEPVLLEGPAREGAKRDYESNIDELIAQLTENPNLSSSFISMQKTSDLENVLQCTDNASLLLPLSEMFPNGTDFSKIGSYEPAEDFEGKNQILSQFNRDLVKYKRVYDYSIGQKFGFLSTMTGKGAKTFLSELRDIEIIAVYKSLEKSFASKILSEFDQDRKKRLVFALQETPLNTQELLALEMKLRARFEGAEVIGQNRVSQDDLMASMIEAEEDPKDLIMALCEDQPELAEKYRKYLITFDDVLESPEKLGGVLEDVSNETLAMALSGLDEEKRERFAEIFPEARAKIISSLELSLNGHKTPQNIKTAQKDIMKIFRQYDRVG